MALCNIPCTRISVTSSSLTLSSIRTTNICSVSKFNIPQCRSSLNHSENSLDENISKNNENISLNRRSALAVSTAILLSIGSGSSKAGLPPVELKKLCDAECEKILEFAELVSTNSGLQFKDVIVGTGPSPPVGFQVAANYVAMVGDGKIFDSSLEKGMPYIFRVGSGQVVDGLDEGILTMKVGGLRRIYVPGSLAFPRGLPSAAGRPRVPPNSPVIFDVQLLYIPGLEDEEE